MEEKKESFLSTKLDHLKLYQTIEELQSDADEWIKHYNEERPHSGRYCYGKTPQQTFEESKKLAWEKELDEENWWTFDTKNQTSTANENNQTVRKE